MTDRHRGKVAVVTGGSSGIGRATAQLLVDEGAYVYITGRRAAELEAAAAQIGRNVTAVCGDVSNPADLDRLYETVKRERERIDIVFANAGVARKEPFGSITETCFDLQFGINVKATLFTAQKALPLLRDGGSIILNGSVSGSKGFPEYCVYAATKAALRSFARSWTTDLQHRRIRVNIVVPGPVDTPALRQVHRATSEQLTEKLSSRIPVGRPGTPLDVARAVSFLACAENSFIAGAELFVDGGLAQV